MAMNAYRNYNTNTNALSGNLEKLSSGYKINRAGDDAAGLAISEKMRAQITGLEAAQKNVKDGISLVKTAEGAMQEIQDMLNRMDYLATQSANGTYQDEVDRENLQKEVNALRTEIDRIADSANFNGIKLLDGSLASGGSNASGEMSVSLRDCGDYQLYQDGQAEQTGAFEIDINQHLTGLSATAKVTAGKTIGTIEINVGGEKFKVTVVAEKTVAAGAALTMGKVTLSVTAATTSVKFKGADNKEIKFEINSDNLDASGKLTFTRTESSENFDFDCNKDVKFTPEGKLKENDGCIENCTTQNVKNNVTLKNPQLAHGGFKLTSAIAKALEAGGELKIDDVTIKFDPTVKTVKAGNNAVIGIQDLLDGNDNLKTDRDTLKTLATRITQAANGCSAFTVGVGADGATITLQERYNYHKDNTDSTYLYTDKQFSDKVSYTGGGAASSGALKLQIGDTGESFNQMSVEVGDMHCTALGINAVDISNQDSAKQAIQTIKDAINQVSSVRGDLGAVQNRLEHTQNNLSVMAENIQDAESTIRDTDVAEEMMKYVKNNILVQSAQAMLAQANQVPQGVLQLLG